MKKFQILICLACVAMCLSECVPEPMQSPDNPFLIGGVEQVSTSDSKINELVERVNEFNYNKTDDNEYVWPKYFARSETMTKRCATMSSMRNPG